MSESVIRIGMLAIEKRRLLRDVPALALLLSLTAVRIHE
jgi:hypothetical protein